MTDRRDIKFSVSTALEDFKRNIMDGKRYIDKTKLLAALLDRDHESTFFLRPWRFGKTLTLSMIPYFEEDTREPALNEENRSLFQGLAIMDAGEKYTGQMTSYPVIHLIMQTVGGATFKEGYDDLKSLIQELYDDNRILLESGRLSEREKKYFLRILNDAEEKKATVSDYNSSLRNLTRFLTRAYGKRRFTDDKS